PIGRAGGPPVPGFRPAVGGRGRGRARQDARRESLDTGGGGEAARRLSAMTTGDRTMRSLTLAAEAQAARRGREGRPPAAGNRRRRRLKGLALLTAFSMWWNALFSVGALAQVIPDGRTETYVETVGSVTDVTTRTVIGSAGLNSFRTFDVGAGATVNLHLPSGAGSLVNIVTGGRRSFIDGTVNALREGRIGGNVYFLNPDGIVGGPDGVINAGALALLTPTREFVDGFFAGGAAGTAAAVSRVLDGAVPADPAGLISVRGQVRTEGDVDVRAGSVGITGELRTGTVFVGQQPQAGLGDVFNIGGIPVPAGEITEAGHIRIVAEGDVQQAGALHADGDDGQAAGRIFITAGGDVVIEHGSVASAQGPAPSSGAGVQAMSVPGPGGGDATVALRAGGTLVLGGGTVASSSAGGPAVMSAGS